MILFSNDYDNAYSPRGSKPKVQGKQQEYLLNGLRYNILVFAGNLWIKSLISIRLHLLTFNFRGWSFAGLP